MGRSVNLFPTPITDSSAPFPSVAKLSIFEFCYGIHIGKMIPEMKPIVIRKILYKIRMKGRFSTHSIVRGELPNSQPSNQFSQAVFIPAQKCLDSNFDFRRLDCRQRHGQPVPDALLFGAWCKSLHDRSSGCIRNGRDDNCNACRRLHCRYSRKKKSRDRISAGCQSSRRLSTF